MADEEKFLLVSLNESKAKKLAQIVSNDTCRKIINFLAEKEATETNIAKELKIPISTVHYNLKHLMNAGLVTAEEYHYSKKGKEINHYKLANKYIIIAPKQAKNIKETIKKLLPVAGIVAVISIFIEFFSLFFQKSGAVLSKSFSLAVQEAAPVMADAAIQTQRVIAEEAAPLMDEVASGAQQVAALNAAPVMEHTARAVSSASLSHIGLWFFIGGITVLILYLLFEIIRNARVKKQVV